MKKVCLQVRVLYEHLYLREKFKSQTEKWASKTLCRCSSIHYFSGMSSGAQFPHSQHCFVPLAVPLLKKKTPTDTHIYAHPPVPSPKSP